MRSLVLLSSTTTAVASTTASARPRALATATTLTQRRRRSCVAAVGGGASATGRSRFAGSPVAFKRHSLRVSVRLQSDDVSASSDFRKRASTDHSKPQIGDRATSVVDENAGRSRSLASSRKEKRSNSPVFSHLFSPFSLFSNRPRMTTSPKTRRE